MIDSYRFGQIVVDGEKYTSDLIIFPERVKGGWWKKRGHLLCAEDLEEVIEEKPEVLIIGTGSPGRLRVPSELEDYLRSQGIDVIVEPTGEACQTFNRLCRSLRVAAALHLTC